MNSRYSMMISTVLNVPRSALRAIAVVTISCIQLFPKEANATTSSSPHVRLRKSQAIFLVTSKQVLALLVSIRVLVFAYKGSCVKQIELLEIATKCCYWLCGVYCIHINTIYSNHVPCGRGEK